MQLFVGVFSDFTNYPQNRRKIQILHTILPILPKPFCVFNDQIFMMIYLAHSAVLKLNINIEITLFSDE